jgi:hypothetical protein
MKTYKITWNEKVFWESYVKANSEKEALNKIDEINENAEECDVSDGVYDLKAEEVEE